MYHKDWLDHDLHQRLLNPIHNYVVRIFPYQFDEMGLTEAAAFTTKLIASRDKRIYVGLSGGADSEYVMKCFIQNNIDATPVIVVHSSNSKEVHRALKMCLDYNLKPHIIKIDDNQFMETLNEYVCGIHGIATNSIFSILACKYTKDNDGVYVSGDHMMGQTKPIIDLSEDELYNNVYFGDNDIPFFYYTMEIAYALAKCNTIQGFNDCKCKIFGVSDRPKLQPSYSLELYNKTTKAITYEQNPNRTFVFSSRRDFIDTYEKYVQRPTYSHAQSGLGFW